VWLVSLHIRQVCAFKRLDKYLERQALIDAASNDAVRAFLESEVPVNEKITISQLLNVVSEFLATTKLSRNKRELLLALLKLFLPESTDNLGRLFDSWHMFNKVYQVQVVAVYRFDYCQKCMHLFGVDDKHCPTCNTPRTHTGGGKVRHLQKYFIQYDIREILRARMEDPEFVADLNEMTKVIAVATDDDTLTDIFSGSIYQERVAAKRLGSVGQLSVCMGVDPVSPRERSNFSALPVLLRINECPSQRRFTERNTIFAGVFFGGKAYLPTFLRPMFEMLNILFAEGIDIETPHFTGKVTMDVVSIDTDMRMRQPLQNFRGANAYYPCSHCYIIGAWIKGSGIVCPVVKVNGEFVRVPLRTEESVRQIYKMLADPLVPANAKSNGMFGVNGVSILNDLMGAGVVSLTGPDSMHQIAEGLIARVLAFVSSDVKYLASPFCDNKATTMAVLNERFLDHRPTTNFVNSIRPITQLGWWTAHDYLEFGIYWVLPYLSDLVAPAVRKFLTLLCTNLYALFNPAPKHSDLDNIEKQSEEVLWEYQLLFGQQAISPSVHQYLHFVDIIKKKGPLWATGMWHFERLGGDFAGRIAESGSFVNSAATVTQVVHTMQQRVIDNSMHPELKQAFKKMRPVLNDYDILNEASGSHVITLDAATG
jgi:hypothetical protein